MTSYWNGIIEVLREEHAVTFDVGLSNAEIELCQREFGIHFPPDLREFLQCALPVSDRFPKWRSGPRDEIRSWLELPLEGILFDVANNGFWLSEWGERPSDFEMAAAVARQLIANAPRLIPI